MEVVDLFSPLRVLYTPHQGPVVPYGPEPLLEKLGLDTEWIIVPFFPKSVNHMAYLAHVVTVIWCLLLFVFAIHCSVLKSSFLFCYAIVFKHKGCFNCPPQFQDQQSPHPLFCIAQCRDVIIGREWNLHENYPVSGGSRTHNFRNSWTEVNKD